MAENNPVNQKEKKIEKFEQSQFVYVLGILSLTALIFIGIFFAGKYVVKKIFAKKGGLLGELALGMGPSSANTMSKFLLTATPNYF